jgi:hypothetical protein
LTPLLVASGIPLITGVEITESKSRTKEASSRTVNGVAGLSIIASEVSLSAQLCRNHIILKAALDDGCRRVYREEYYCASERLDIGDV